MPSEKPKTHRMSAWLKTKAEGNAASSTISPASDSSKPAVSKKGKSKKQRPKTMAELADKYQLYQQAVQHPRKEVRNLDRIYRKLNSRYLDSGSRRASSGTGPRKDGCNTEVKTSRHKDKECEDDTDGEYVGRRQAYSLREDFCGTAVLCMEWVSSSPSATRYAYGVDIDPEVIEYACEHTIGRDSHGLTSDDRIKLVCADVFDVHGDDSKVQGNKHTGNRTVPRTDIIASFNFGICYFHKRQDLVRYLKHSLGNLNDFGLLFCDLFGGHEAVRSGISRVRNVGTFRYYFRQGNFDMLRNTTRFSLSFRMQDGSMLKDCFTYDFRVYSLCELREAMLEAGFDDVCVWISAKDSVEELDESESESERENKNENESDYERSRKKKDSPDFGAFEELILPAEMPESFNAYVIGVKLPA
ncbi:hypothetical protein LPJ72_000182 [Coemansia sp. Benny D160-2]|nr:hypothetical protein LPJ72_000182 [Coemansia sp. Benny D160-2]